jgi:hypothetical protein
MSLDVVAPLRPETRGQAAACPNRTRAIPYKVAVSYDGRDAERARYVPNRSRQNSVVSLWISRVCSRSCA